MTDNKSETIKLFISQPMRDKTNEEIEFERQKAIDYTISLLKDDFNDERPVEVIQSFFKDAPHEAKPLWFLGESLKCLSNADIAYFCAGWENYRGCRIEHICCEDYEIPIIVD